jgi:tetratricopeptide (TPR) repeat protein
MKMETKYRFTNILFLFVLVIFFLVSTLPTSAKTITYIKEYTYQASEIDSKLSCRTIALEQVKRLLLEELGTYLISETAVRDFELTKDEISSLTAGIVMTVILDEKWDGKIYFLKAKITVDSDELVTSIDNVRKDWEQNKNLEEMRRKTEQALKEIERLKREIEDPKAGKRAKEEYAKVVNELNAIDWFKKGYALKRIKNNKEALQAFDKAIELQPNFGKAYAGRAAVYVDWRQYEKALQQSEKAIQLEPKLPWAYKCRGDAYMGLQNYQKAIENYDQAIELYPKAEGAYCNRSYAYHKLKKYPQALEDANKAIMINPKLFGAYFNRGRALASLNNYQDAIAAFDKAIELAPMFSRSFLDRGNVFLKLGKIEQAIEDFKKAARFGDDQAQTYLKNKGIRW